MLFGISNITKERLTNELTEQKQVGLTIVRLDKIHPIVSGNKLFKLHFFLDEAIRLQKNTIITFGGAYSNHLVATALRCKMAGLNSVGIVRGEKPKKLSHTLEACMDYGMELIFISRKEYERKVDPAFQQTLKLKYPDYYLIPEGGFGILGSEGAARILDNLDEPVTHICCAIGTATTVAGLLTGIKAHQQVLGIPVLKGLTDIESRILHLTRNKINLKQLQLFHNYHFGGYAKYTPELIRFMNQQYNEHHLPTDFVYTAKMLFATMDLIKKDYFPKGSKIACLHTGGLQGNLSLPAGSLVF
jgi:1-aminocyclopropane-1-carboxylate deaminase/D-cysteine desulfhydrase-like pyridoxal-dependent ACC family enzyme